MLFATEEREDDMQEDEILALGYTLIDMAKDLDKVVVFVQRRDGSISEFRAGFDLTDELRLETDLAKIRADNAAPQSDSFETGFDGTQPS